MPIVDRRSSRRDKGSESRKRFINRHKKYLNGKINDVIKDKSIKDLAGDGDKTIRGNKDSITIGSPSKETDNDPKVIPGNKHYSKGDEIAIPKKGAGGPGPGEGQQGGLSEDEFQFVISKDEFRNMLFEGLSIPNLYKKSGEGEEVESIHRAGFTRRGIPGRLHILKTYMQAIGRHLSDGKDPEDEIDLDDEDLRYRNLVTRTRPITKAVMFAVMDTSGSMGEEEKTRAKKFFLLMYLFLMTKYTNIDVVFIKYHEQAREVTEEEFFTSTDTGGTQTTVALELVQKIINERYDTETDNMYVTLVSDGGEWDISGTLAKAEELLPCLNYFAYMECCSNFGLIYQIESLFLSMKLLERKYPGMVGCAKTVSEDQVYNALRSLFEENQ